MKFLISKSRHGLLELDLTAEEMEEHSYIETFLVSNPRGRLIAEKIRMILETLED